MAGLPDRVRRGVHVEPRPVHRQHRLPGDRQALRRGVAGLAVVDPERLRDRVRRAARAGGALGGRVRAQARVPARAGDLRGGEHGVRARAVGRLPDRGARRAGGRRRADAADVAGPDAAGVRPARAPCGDRRVGRDRRHRRGGGPAAGRPARAGRLALGVPRERPDRAARPRLRRCARWRSGASSAPGARTCSARAR